MSDENIKRYSAKDLRRKADLGQSRTDFARIDTLSDECVERSIADDPEDMPENWLEHVEAVMPRPKVPVSIRLDQEVLDYFRAGGPGWQTRINAVLRAYKDARKAAAT